MMNKCIYLRIRSKKGIKYGLCLKYNKKVSVYCKCEEIEYKKYKELIKKSKSQKDLDNSRVESLFTNNLNKCYFCDNKKDHLHEVFYGKNRSNSIKYKLFIPVCNKHHRKCHNDITLIDSLHKKGQVLFNINYPYLNFVDIFKENYL